MVTQAYDFAIIGSGFGGSTSALRLTEKGYRVLVLEKGRRFRAEDFPKTNWDLKRWLWAPALGLRGIFQMSFLPHVTVLHGVGVGGGSLVYANTLPMPKDDFFAKGSWAGVREWKAELAPHYATARRMLGAARVPTLTKGDRVLAEIARDMGRSEHHTPAEVGVFFGAPGVEVDDPYFEGAGPRRTGCTECGACMTGCRVGAKNTLDRNYLYLAEKGGAEVRAETEVTWLEPIGTAAAPRYRLTLSSPEGETVVEVPNVVFSGGVMGTIPLLLRLRESPRGLPKLSERVGDMVRTNSESLIGVVAAGADDDLSRGVAITSILHTDPVSHVEPVRYGAGSGFFRILSLPHAPGESVFSRVGGGLASFFARPSAWLRALTAPDFAKQSQVLLYMRTMEGSLRMRLGRGLTTAFRRGLVTELEAGTAPPRAFMPEATDLANRFAEKVGGVTMSIVSETIAGTPTTAHILGGACIGRDAESGVIDAQHRVFGYPGLYVADGSAVSANPGVNPSLTITAMTERAMTFIPPRRTA